MNLTYNSSMTPEMVYGFMPTIPERYMVVDFRPAKKGETFIAISDAQRMAGTVSAAVLDHGRTVPRLILKPIPTPASIYGTNNVEAPEGYVLDEFRPLRKGDIFIPYVADHNGYSDRTCGPIDNPTGPNEYRWIVKPVPARTFNEVYGAETKWPEGYWFMSFRPLQVGDLYLSNFMPGQVRVANSVIVDLLGDKNPRAILQKIPEGFQKVAQYRAPSRKIVRVVRVLEYVGPEDWIKTTLEKSVVTPDGIKGNFPGTDRAIRELSTFKEEVK